MNNYLEFVRALSPYQQRAEIARLVFLWRDTSGHYLEDELLKLEAEEEFGKIAGEDPAGWSVDFYHSAEQPELIEAPVFEPDQCRARFLFRYLSRDRGIEIPGLIFIDEERRAQIANGPCRACSSDSLSRDRLIKLGVNPDTHQTVDFSAWQPPALYLDWLRELLPEQRNDAILDLRNRVWRWDNDPPLNHPDLVSELIKRRISNLFYDESYIGPVEFEGERCTVHMVYYCVGDQDGNGYDEIDDKVPAVELHVLTEVTNKPDLSIRGVWYRIEALEDLEDPILLA